MLLEALAPHPEHHFFSEFLHCVLVFLETILAQDGFEALLFDELLG